MLPHRLFNELCFSLKLCTRYICGQASCARQYIVCSESSEKEALELVITPNFVSKEEELSLITEINRIWKHPKYEYSHWDNAIIGFRETEKRVWKQPHNMAVMQKMMEKTVLPTMKTTELYQPLPFVHILDLAGDGYIKPHIDSLKFCGGVIAGLSLLSSSVMKLTHHKDSNKWILALLPPCSLYIMRDNVRYDYAHEILSNTNSYFMNKHIVRDRRVSIVCRTKPSSSSL